MSVLKVEAAIECEGCGKHFRVDIDTGHKPPDGWDVIDIARDAVMGGHVSEFLKRPDPGISSVQDGDMLCPDCTKERDAEHEYEAE